MPGGHGSRTAKRTAARKNRVPSRRTLQRLAKKARKAREAAAAEDYDNVGQDPLPDNFGDVDIHDIGGADNGDVSAGLGAGTSGVGCGANAESLPTIGARAVPAQSFGPYSAYCKPT